jgi:site-specific DNA-methyltransferase (adenine-specific)
MRRLFALFTKPGELIIDCFNGAGTSTLVAQEMRRRYLGIELSKRFHNLAVRRHENLSRGVDPFGKTAAIPKVKNSNIERVAEQEYKVSKKALQLEAKRIAVKMGRLPTREDLIVHSTHPIEYYSEYFRNWSEVCAAARLAISDEVRAGTT